MAHIKVDCDEIRKLADLLNETGLTEIEVGDNGSTIRVTKNGVVQAVSSTPLPAAANMATPGIVEAPAEASLDKHPGAVKSPMVGTAYLQPEPSSPKFATVGQSVSEGDTLLIIEAMKVMNPITAHKSGVVKQILIEDAQPVEFDEILVIIE